MQWLDPKPSGNFPAATLLALARAAVERSPDNPLLKARLGALLVRAQDFTPALAALEEAAARDPSGFGEWNALAQCYLKLGRAQDVLALARRLRDREPSALLETSRGLALRQLGRFEEARAALMDAIALSDDDLSPHFELLHMIACRKDGAALLDACDAMPARVQNLALVTGHRALGFSMLRRSDAEGLVDLATQVTRLRFEPPAEFGGIERFNQVLANEILGDPDPSPSRREGRNINYKDDLYRTPAKWALRDFTRSAVEAYLATTRPRTGLPPPPSSGTLWGAHTILRRSGRNGQHLHHRAYVSTIYYVSLPALDPDSDRGALELGCCDEYTRGHAPIWGLRRLRPEPGTLVIFPSHIFHDVVPTGSDQPRISVVADLLPSPG